MTNKYKGNKSLLSYSNPLNYYHKFKILHVDDNEDFRNLFSMGFRKWFDVTSVSSGNKALEYLSNKKFDAVITDFEMPDTNGLELLKTIRSIFPYLPVIFYTGQGSEAIAREAFLSGVNDYFAKEFNSLFVKERIVNSVKQAIEREKTKNSLLKEKDRALKYFNGSNVITIVIDTKEKIKMINRFGCELLGYREEEVLNKNCFEILNSPQLASIIKPLLENSLYENGPPSSLLRYEIETQTKTGEKKIISWSNTILKDEKGQVESVLSSGIDITQRKFHEKQIHHLNKVLKAIQNINQLIIQESEKIPLIKKACHSLVDIGKYLAAGIIITDKNKKIIASEYVWNQEESVKTPNDLINNICPNFFKDILEKINLNNKSKILYHLPCLDNDDFSYQITPLINSKNILGVLLVCFPSNETIDREEQNLIQEVADDIAYALVNIDNEKALIKSEKNYRTIFNTSLNGIIVFDLTKKEVTQVNKAFIDMTSFTLEEIVNSKGKILSTGIPPYTLKDSYNLLTKVISGQAQQVEWKIKNKNGAHLWVEASINFAKLNDNECLIACIKNITKRKEIEEKIIESEKKYSFLINNINDGIAVINKELFITLANDKMHEITGYPKEKIIGCFLPDLFDDKGKEILYKNITLRKKGINKKYKIKFINKNQKEVTILVSPKALFNNQEEFLGSIVLISDITEIQKDK